MIAKHFLTEKLVRLQLRSINRNNVNEPNWKNYNKDIIQTE